jgi:hypothetical protein
MALFNSRVHQRLIPLTKALPRLALKLLNETHTFEGMGRPKLEEGGRQKALAEASESEPLTGRKASGWLGQLPGK